MNYLGYKGVFNYECVFFQSHLSLPIKSNGQNLQKNVNFLFQQIGGARRADQTSAYTRSAHKTLWVFSVCFSSLRGVRKEARDARSWSLSSCGARGGARGARSRRFFTIAFLLHFDRFVSKSRHFSMKLIIDTLLLLWTWNYSKTY